MKRYVKPLFFCLFLDINRAAVLSTISFPSLNAHADKTETLVIILPVPGIHCVNKLVLIKETILLKYSGQFETYSRYAAVTAQPCITFFSHCRVWPCSNNAGNTTWRRSNSSESSLTGTSLQEKQKAGSLPVYWQKEKQTKEQNKPLYHWMYM